MSHLVSYYSQTEPNLRRTASKGLISLLNHYQLEDLAFKYFGIKDEYGNIIGYQCPYSGKVYTDYKDIVLEHIVPVVSKGGTVLFNCIPTSKEVNGSDQKGAKHLITWWINSKYWNKEAPLRLEKIINYMLDAYDQVFTEYTIDEVESSYLEIDTDESNLDEKDNLEYSEVNENKLLRQAKNNGIHSYLGFILDCINTLENKEICNIDTTDIRRKLTELKDKHIFEDIERYQLFQNIIQKLIVSRIGDDNRSYLTYSLNFDIKKLMDSIKYNNPEEIYNELNTRLHNIEQLLQENNLSTIEYFKSLKDIPDIDIIYKNNISQEEIKVFLENIKIGIDTKIDIFIEMLTDKQYTSYKNGKPTEKNIFRAFNKIPFKGYESIDGLNTSSFWNNNSGAIIKRLDYLEENSNSNEEREKYQKARRAVEEYEFYTKLETRIDCFIDMLTDKYYTSYENGAPTEKNIFRAFNKIPFKGYESIDGLNTSSFWNNNSGAIIKRLDYLEENSNSNEEREKYQKARRAVEEYEFYTKLETRIDCFIDMLTDKKYTSYENGKLTENNIFGTFNKIPFKGYESIDGLNTSSFWGYNSEIIIKRLDYLEENSNSNEEREKYQKARRAIEEFKFYTKLETRIDCFIDMLTDKYYTSYENGAPTENNIFGTFNKIPFKGYESIDGLNASSIWRHNSEIIIKRLDYLEENSNSNEEREKYQKARRAIEEFEFYTKLETRIDCFIDMLTDKKYTSYENGAPTENNIFKNRNKIPFKGYESIDGLNTSSFWNNNSEAIIKRLDYLEKNSKTYEEREKYKNAKKAIKEFKFQCQNEGFILRVDCFIDMLTDKYYTSYKNGKPTENNIFKNRNKIPFKGYENIDGLNTSSFWCDNSIEIIKRLNYLEENSKNNEEKEKYQRARKAIREYEFQCDSGINLRIESFIEMLGDKKYTSYENAKPNENNIFKDRNRIAFKGYESIDGLNTSSFWNHNSQKLIIPLLFFNKQYDKNNKVYVDSEKDYSNKEYDAARNAVLEYLQVKDIHEYIDKLEQKEKKNAKVMELINLRNNLRKTLEFLRLEEEKLIAENNQLRNEYIKMQEGIETRRAV